MTNKHVSGFVSILGRPNAGKSTLLNALVGFKVAIVANKPQTTRTSIQGVLTTPEAQVVFIDTPGIHKAENAIQKRMMNAVRDALNERDLLLYLADATERFTEADRHALTLLGKSDAPAILVLNKTDLVKQQEVVLPLIDQYRQLHDFVDYIPISALRGSNLDALRAAIISRMPEGPRYFPEDHVTDQPERFIAAELIREKILQETGQEVPHSVAVLIDRWEEAPNITRIYATVFVEREGQKGIVIGQGGQMLKRIGTQARQDMENLLGVRIFLQLHIKVQPNWREKPAFLNALDWRTMADTNET
ncbi:MAG: GTPase Era [Acidobacteriota bacterium]|nr:GTPase Era [Acidobacteriota bacterium]